MGDAKKRILLVEDYEPTIIMTSFFLEDEGYECDVASSGAAALQKSAANTYALIIMDLQLPDMDGLDITRQIRLREKDNHLPQTPIIAATGKATADDQMLCLKAGMNDCLIKPFELDDLAQKLEQWA